MAEDIKVKFSADTSELGKAQGVISKLGGALRLLAFGAVAREALQLADEVDKLSKRFNISTDAVQELQYASKQTGVEFNQVASAMAIASRRVNEATAGIGDANKSLSALNLNAK
jgi:histone H3/H4